MSGSLTGIYENTRYALQLHGRAITFLQEQAATGNRVNQGSDSPSDAHRLLALDSEDRSLDGYKEAIDELVGNLEVSSTVVTGMTGQLADARTILTQIIGGIYDAEGQKRVADRLNNVLEQMVSLSNTNHGDRFLFGGDRTASAPYAVVREGGRIVQVNYQGSDQTRRVDVAPGVDVETYRVGDEIFRADDRSDPVFLGQTGAAVGTGTSNVRGDVWLTVDHDGANYRVSIDDGATWVTVPAGGDANQAVTDSRTGRVLYVDTTGIDQTGVELVRVPGTYDIFSTLISLRDILMNQRGLSQQEVIDYTHQCIAAIEEVHQRLVQAEVSTGSEIGFLSTLKQNLENMQADTRDEATRLQEADIAQIAIELSRRQILYEMSLSVAGKLMTTSLLDFIQ